MWVTEGSPATAALLPEEGTSVSLVAEWQLAAQAQYDAAAAQRPEQHATAIAVERARREGGKSVSLAECVEVRWPLPGRADSPGSAGATAADPTPKRASPVQAFLQPEQLDEEDRWYCCKCKQHVQARAWRPGCCGQERCVRGSHPAHGVRAQADKKLDLWTLPDTLVVHLKRFSYSRFSRDKLDTLVEFPLQGLNLRQYLLSPGGEVSTSARSH